MSFDVSELPMEMLAKIFSFFSSDAIVNLSSVCSKFNAAAKHPSLWRRCQIIYNSSNYRRKIPSFCSFFSLGPHFRELSITANPPYSINDSLNSESVNSLNHLFANMKNLQCFSTDIDLTNIVLPPTLKHLTCILPYGLVSDWEQFSFLQRCSNIESLYIRAFGTVNLTNAVKTLLLKYELSLSTFHIEVSNFAMEWVPLLKRCKKLKVLGLGNTVYSEEYISPLFTALSSRLEELYLEHEFVLDIYSEILFPEIKHLIIKYPISQTLSDCKLFIKRMPKLETFCFAFKLRDGMLHSADISDLLESFQTLRCLVVRGKFSEVELEAINRSLNEGTTPENNWQVTYHPIYEKFSYSYQCYCWDSLKYLPKVVPVDRTQRKQLLILGFDGDTSGKENEQHIIKLELKESLRIIEELINESEGIFQVYQQLIQEAQRINRESPERVQITHDFLQKILELPQNFRELMQGLQELRHKVDESFQIVQELHALPQIQEFIPRLQGIIPQLQDMISQIHKIISQGQELMPKLQGLTHK